MSAYAAHRYCVGGPSIFDDDVKWFCEGCVHGKTEPAAPCRKSEFLGPTVERVAPLKLVRRKFIDTETDAPNETAEGDSKISIVNHQKKDVSVKGRQSTPTEKPSVKGVSNPSIKNQKKNDRSLIRKQSKATEKPSFVLKETAKGVSDPSIKDQKRKIGTRKRKQLNPTGELYGPAKEGSDLSIVDQKVDGCGKRNLLDPSIKDQKKKIGNVKRKKLNPIGKLKGPAKESSDLSIVDQKVDGCGKRKLSKPPEKPTGALKETAEGTSVVSSIDRKEGTVSVKRKPSKLRKTRTSVLPHVSDATEVNVSATGIGKGNDTSVLPLVSDATEVNVSATGIEKGNDTSVLPHVSDATEVIVSATGIGKDNDSVLQHAHKCTNPGSCDDIKECAQDMSRGRKYSGPRKQLGVANKGENIKELDSDNDVKKGCSEAVHVTGQKIKNMNSSDKIVLQPVKLGMNVGPLQSKVEDHVKETTCVVEDSIEGNSKYGKQQKFTNPLLSKKEMDCVDESTLNADEKGCHGTTGSDKSSCEDHSELLEELYINNNSSGDAEQGDQSDNKNSGLEETTADFVPDQQADALFKRDVSQCQAPRKRRRLVIQMEYSDEEPVLVVAKNLQRVADVSKDPSCKLSSEAPPKLIDDGLGQLSSVDSVHRRSPMNVDDCVLTRQPSVVYDNDGFAQPSVKLVNDVPALPVVDAAWRGYCTIKQIECPTSLVLEAHLSNKSHEKVQGAVIALPESLNFDCLPKKDVWPKSFEQFPPTRDNIGLFFFPVEERDEKVYERLIDNIFDCGLVLKSYINNLELLVFCSLELPREEWSLRRKYFLWGVFKPKGKGPVMPNKPSNVHICNVQSPLPDNSANHLCTTRAISASASPSSLVDQGICPQINSSNTRVHQEVVGQSQELTRPTSSTPFKQPHDQPVCSQINSSSSRVYQEDVGLSDELTQPISSTPLKQPHDQAVCSRINSSNTHTRQEDVGESDGLTSLISSRHRKRPRDVGQSDDSPISSMLLKRPRDQATDSRINSSNTRVHKDNVGSSDGFRPISSMPFKGYSNHKRHSRDRDVSYRKDYHLRRGKFWKPHPRDHGGGEYSEYAEQQHDYGEHGNGRWNTRHDYGEHGKGRWDTKHDYGEHGNGGGDTQHDYGEQGNGGWDTQHDYGERGNGGWDTQHDYGEHGNGGWDTQHDFGECGNGRWNKRSRNWKDRYRRDTRDSRKSYRSTRYNQF